MLQKEFVAKAVLAQAKLLSWQKKKFTNSRVKYMDKNKILKQMELCDEDFKLYDYTPEELESMFNTQKNTKNTLTPFKNIFSKRKKGSSHCSSVVNEPD